jgi:hypothetical protein
MGRRGRSVARAAACATAVSCAAVTARAQNAVSLASLSGYGNFHAGGVVAVISGDANGNASAALEWRPAGGAFRAAQPLARIDATRFAGSLFGLSPGSAYEARVTLADPDGVVGAPAGVTAVTTRADALAEPTLRTLYVAPTGNDANPGTDPMLPKRTIQGAADVAQAGDLVLIQPGVYRESVSVPRSGTAAQPLVFRGNGGGVVLDGADAAIAGGVAWTSAGGGAYVRTLGFATGHVVSEAGRLFRYDSLAALQALGAGAPGGFFFDGTRLYVKFADGGAPAAHTLHVARYEDGVVIDGRAFVRVENLEIRHYGAGDYGKGVYLRYASDSVVRGCRIHEVGAAGVWIKGGERQRVEDNAFWDTSIFGWPWDLTKGSSAENTAVLFSDDVGRGHVVRRNDVSGFFNGIGPCGSAPPPAGVTNETDVYDNTLARHADDAFEPEGYCANVRLWGNVLRDVHMAFAVAPAAPGPTWIVRNVAFRVGNTRTSQQDGYIASALKINSGYPTPIGPLLVYHNTFLTDAPATDAVALLDPGASTYVRARNNVFAGTRYALYKVNPVAWSGDGDDLHTTAPGRLVSWMGVRYDSLAAFQALGQEAQGLSAPPLLVDPEGGDFTPQAASELVDAGLPLAGINDDFAGAAPDVGAIERPALPGVSIADATLVEGDLGVTTAVAGVSLSAPSAQTVSVSYATADETATAASDYGAVDGTLVFAPGTTSRSVSVPVFGDRVLEGAETLRVELSEPSGAVITGAQALVTIGDDDAAGLSVADVVAVERPGAPATARFTVTLAPSVAGPVSVQYQTLPETATAGNDYVPAAGTLDFAPGVTARTLDVTIHPDAVVEGPETLVLQLHDAVGAPIAAGTGRATLLDPPRPGDFNPDGRSDIVFRHAVSGRNVVWLMDGTTRIGGLFTAPDTVPDLNWEIVGTNDFNADGRTDLLWRHRLSGRNVVWLMDGTVRTSGVFTTPDTLADANWRIVASGDFNADGQPDIVFRHAVSGRSVVWLMQGTVRVAGLYTTPDALVGAEWSVTGAGDFDADGRADLLWSNAATRKLLVWLMHGTARREARFTTPDAAPDAAWSVQGVADFSGDGRPDLLWRHASSGALLVWQMNGLTLGAAGSTTPSALPDVNWRIVGPR